MSLVLLANSILQLRQRASLRSEAGQSTAEYGIVVLVAIALGTAVLMLFTGGVFDSGLSALLSTVLSTAASMVRAG